MHDNLERHYNKKYLSAYPKYANEYIPMRLYPCGRFEGCVHYFSKLFKGGKVLELSGADGRIARSLMKYNDNIESYYISEFTEQGASFLRQNLTDSRFEIFQINAELVPESWEKQFDAIVMVALIEHLIDPLRAMQKIRKLLKPGGFIYIDTPNIAKYTRRIKLFLGQFPSTASANEGLTTYEKNQVDMYDDGHLHYFTYRSLDRMLTEYCGFTQILKCGYGCEHLKIKSVEFMMGRVWPEMFSEIAIVAY